MKTYSELKKLKTFEDRFRYLMLNGTVGSETFGEERFMNQELYGRSSRWKKVRKELIIRDIGCDLGIEGFDLRKIIVHHINPITREDLIELNPILFDPDNLICCSLQTHNAIHYGDESYIFSKCTGRSPGDTKLWK